MAPPPTVKPFQLLEINIISAQDLELVSKKMKTYATAWVHDNRKLTTVVDNQGNCNPTWNDKFVFRVDDGFLQQDTSAVMIEIYSVGWFGDKLVGTVRVLVGNLVPPSTSRSNHLQMGMRFVALQIRRPSGRPQGILNIGVALLDGSMRSMPLYRQLSASAVGYRDLMGNEVYGGGNDDYDEQSELGGGGHYESKPTLRRSRSERSERFNFDDVTSFDGSSILTFTATKDMLGKTGGGGGGSMVNGSDVNQFQGKKGKASSIVNGSDLNQFQGKESSIIINGADLDQFPVKKGKKASSVINVPEIREEEDNKKPKKKASSVINSSILSISNHPPAQFLIQNDKSKPNKHNPTKIPDLKEKPIERPGRNANVSPPIGKPKGGPKGTSVVNGGGKYVPKKPSSIWSDSEVGPSPSEVAAAMAHRDRYHQAGDDQSSILDGWSMDESVEGLRSKLERWRTELPPLYDQGFDSVSYPASSSTRTSGQGGHHARRHSAADAAGGSGLFSCFGNLAGYEYQCICGKPPPERKRNNSGPFSSPATSRSRSLF